MPTIFFSWAMKSLSRDSISAMPSACRTHPQDRDRDSTAARRFSLQRLALFHDRRRARRGCESSNAPGRAHSRSEQNERSQWRKPGLVPWAASGGRALRVGWLFARSSHQVSENLNWIRQKKQTHRPSHIALYDLQSGTCVEDIETEPHGIGVVFSLF